MTKCEPPHENLKKSPDNIMFAPIKQPISPAFVFTKQKNCAILCLNS